MAQRVAPVRRRSTTVTATTTTGGGTAAIATTALAKDYGGALALAPLDLFVPAGQRISLIGHNGSGKTTLLRLLSGMLEPSDGAATVTGHPVGTIEARAAIAHLADQPVFYDDLSVREHLEYIARLHGRAEWEERADELLDATGLTERADELPSTFSRGLRQKAAVCLAFVRPFEVMVVDEPFVGLDRAGRVALLELFRSAHGGGATLVIATHELGTVDESDRIVALRDGVVVFDGRPGEADLDDLVDVND
jgi:ABC-type multidrug transport system ATPase subunit